MYNKKGGFVMKFPKENDTKKLLLNVLESITESSDKIAELVLRAKANQKK